MEGAEWKRAASRRELVEGRPLAVEVDGKKLLLVQVEGKIYACGNECSHYKELLSDGLLAGHIVTCPSHNARFDVRTGALEAAPGLNDLPTWETKVQGGAVHVRQTGSGTIPMPAGEDSRTFLIVGGGAAGNSAAEGLRREGFAGRILVLSAESRGPYDRPNLSKDYLSGEIPAKWLPLRGEKFYARLRIEVLTGQRVVGLEARGRAVRLADGRTLKGEAILLATGGAARTLEVPGAGLPGVFTLRTWEDADRILAAVQDASGRGGRAVIIGASFIGLETAASLRKRGLEVGVTAPESVPLAGVFGERVGQRLQRLHEEHGVSFHLGRRVKEMRGNGGSGQVAEVLLDDGSRLPADFVVVGIGIRPATDFLSGSGVELGADGGVVVGPTLQTAVPGVFAAGDIASVPVAGGGLQRVEHWVVAQRQGAHAARAMLGASEAYEEVPFFWSRSYGGSVRYVGHAQAGDRIVFRGDPDGGPFVAGFYAPAAAAGGGAQGEPAELLRAACGVNTPREIIRLGQLLASGRGPSAEQLQDPAFDLLSLRAP